MQQMNHNNTSSNPVNMQTSGTNATMPGGMSFFVTSPIIKNKPHTSNGTSQMLAGVGGSGSVTSNPAGNFHHHQSNQENIFSQTGKFNPQTDMMMLDDMN